MVASNTVNMAACPSPTARPADRVTLERQRQQRLHRAGAQMREHAALHDAELGRSRAAPGTRTRDRTAHRIDSSIEARAWSSVAGNGVHSSNAMVMVASNWSWMAVELSGVSRCAVPSRWERKVTPSASILRSPDSDMTWKPPESVRIGPGQSMKRCRPPNSATRAAPGRSMRW